MEFVQTQEQDVAASAESSSSLSDIDSLLSEILNDPNVFSLLESPSPAPSPQPPSCLSPSAQQLEQEALASIGQLPQQSQYPAESHIPHYPPTETPSPTTPSPTIDSQTFFPQSHTHHPPTSLPICPPHSTPVQSPLINCEIALSSNIRDTCLRGQHGYLISLSQAIAKVFLYSLGQECQLPCDYVELVVPAVGDYVRVVEGPLTGTVGYLVNCVGTNSCIQLFNGQYMRAELRNIAKMALRAPSGVPCSSPSAITPLTSPTSPLLSPHHPSPPPFPSPQYSSRSARSPYTSNTGYPNNHCLRLPRGGSRGGHVAAAYPHSNNTRDHRQFCNRMSEATQRQMSAYIRTQGGRNHARGNHNMKYRFQHLLQISSMKTLCKQQPLPSDVERPTEEILEEVRQREAPEYDFGSSGDGGEVSSSCIQVSLTCPLSHKRMVLPCRGIHCKHPQCFDGEAYIEFNKCALKPKEKGRNGCHSYQSAKHQVLKCPLCAKHTSFSQLYIDKVTMEIIQDTEADEVEFDKTGSWKPVEKKSAQEEDVIDLTVDDDDT